MGHNVVPIVMFIMLGLIPISFSPLGRALARRIAGEPGVRDAQDDAEIESLHGEVAELRRELDEVQNRLDFAERLLAQAKERGLLNAPREQV
jgi:hypothetical protein